MKVHLVSFITVEDGTDQIVSFAVINPEDGSYLDSLNVIRTPVYEQFLEPHERGPSVSFPLADDSADRRSLLRVSSSSDRALLTIGCEGRSFALDISKVEPAEIDAMIKLFRRMSIGSVVELVGI